MSPAANLKEGADFSSNSPAYRVQVLSHLERFDEAEAIYTSVGERDFSQELGIEAVQLLLREGTDMLKCKGRQFSVGVFCAMRYRSVQNTAY
jgi:hypothetical protein